MKKEKKYVYNGKFEGNILAMGKTSCRKTYFVRKNSVNNLFGDLKIVEWLSQIELSTSREAEIQSCFDTQADFHYPASVDDLDELLQHFKKSLRERESNDSITPSDNKNIFGEK